MKAKRMHLPVLLNKKQESGRVCPLSCFINILDFFIDVVGGVVPQAVNKLTTRRMMVDTCFTESFCEFVQRV
jgi:hypothetical protein